MGQDDDAAVDAQDQTPGRGRKLIVCNSDLTARRLFETFGLDPEVWEFCAFGAALAGRHYEEIVVFNRGFTSASEAEMALAFTHKLGTHLPPDKAVKVF